MAKLSRRKFLGMTGATVAAAYLPWRFGAQRAMAFSQTASVVPLFGTNLRGIGTIGVAAADSFKAPVTGVQHYTINIDEYLDDGVCPALGPTRLRGYNPAKLLVGQKDRHLSGIIVGQKGTPIQITFRNNLPNTPLIPMDQTIPGAGVSSTYGITFNNRYNRTATHFHGGLVPWISDGGPFDWFAPDGSRGASFLNNSTLNPAAAVNEAEYYYGLNQSARFGWYHDHAFGITRTNAYAGIATGLIIRDSFEFNLQNQGLPGYIEASGNEIPIIIQDKIFVGPNTATLDPTWANVSSGTALGSLWYAHVYEKNRWKLAGAGKIAPPDPSVIAEFFGDTMLVNGTTFPKAAVEPRRYRLRFLNACNARFLNLQFFIADGSPNGITLNAAGNPTNAPALVDPVTKNGASVLQIGTEGGFLPKPVSIPTSVAINPALVPAGGSLIVAPAERPDVLIDFTSCAGKSVILYNDAPAPFPVGDPRNDYFPGWNVKNNPTNGTTLPGYGPNSRILMRFDVASGITGAADVPLTIDTTTNLSSGIDAPIVPFGVTAPPPGVYVRTLSLNEGFDAYGRLIQMLGTLVPPTKGSNFLGRAYTDPVTEKVTAGSTEVWEIYNTTADVHPMHFHLVNAQVLNRQLFSVSSLTNGTPTLTGPVLPPNPNETGWKETVAMYPGSVTRIVMRFDLPQILTSKNAVIPTPASPRTTGNEYVWHCHILEHEEHDMMRPLVVI